MRHTNIKKNIHKSTPNLLSLSKKSSTKKNNISTPPLSSLSEWLSAKENNLNDLKFTITAD